MYGTFAVYVKGIFWEVSDKHLAGVSANKVFTWCALVCEYFTDLVSKHPAMQNCLHSEETFKRNIAEKEKTAERYTGSRGWPKPWRDGSSTSTVCFVLTAYFWAACSFMEEKVGWL